MNVYSPLEHQGLALDFVYKCENEDFADLLKYAHSVQEQYPDNRINWYKTFELIEIKKDHTTPLRYSGVQDCCKHEDILFVSEAEKREEEAHKTRVQELKKILQEYGLS